MKKTKGNLENVAEANGVKLISEVNAELEVIRTVDNGVHEGGGSELRSTWFCI